LQEKLFDLVEQFNSNEDAKQAFKTIKNENALFGRRKRILFESKNHSIVFNFGIYEEKIVPYYVK
jgi:hypothetical protein